MKEIAEELYTYQTIRNTVSSLYSKLGTEPATHCLVVTAQQLNLTTQGA